MSFLSNAGTATDTMMRYFCSLGPMLIGYEAVGNTVTYSYIYIHIHYKTVSLHIYSTCQPNSTEILSVTMQEFDSKNLTHSTNWLENYSQMFWATQTASKYSWNYATQLEHNHIVYFLVYKMLNNTGIKKKFITLHTGV